MTSPFHKQLANMLTLANLVFGLVAIYLSIKSRFELSVLFIVLAGVVDVFDGRIARKLNITSEIGKFLDSNSDLISFGIAPATLVYFSVLEQFQITGPIVAAVFIISSSYRLAKFNAVEFRGYFIGIPTTIAGPVLAISVLLRDIIPSYTFLILAIVLAYLMVGNFKVKKPT